MSQNGQTRFKNLDIKICRILCEICFFFFAAHLEILILFYFQLSRLGSDYLKNVPLSVREHVQLLLNVSADARPDAAATISVRNLFKIW